MNPSDDLSGLLQSWSPQAGVPDDFERGVWQRIENEEGRNEPVVLDLFSWVRFFALPRVALTAAAVALFGGVLLGTLQARTSGEEQYLRSLNPYAQHAHSH